MAQDFETHGMSREDMERIAALAPAEDPPTPQRETGRLWSGLGKVDIGKYLSHYGREYNLKEDGLRSLYRLPRCLFDENHGRNEAAIVQDAQGVITYQCFHDSCNHIWKEARELISGKDELTQFMEGYDPRLRKSKRHIYQTQEADDPITEVATGFLAKMHVGTPLVSFNSPGIPLPPDINPGEFFLQKGKRRGFVFERMADYLGLVLQPIVFTNGVAWRFVNGVWSVISERQIAQVVTAALKQSTSPNFIDGSIKVVAAKLNREEEDWPQKMEHINCLNGMVNIETGKLEPHNPDAGYRVQIPVNFDWKAECPRWLQFLEEIFPGKPGKAAILQEFMGYCLLGDCRFEKALFLRGEGANGKGTILHALRSVIGAENSSSLNLKDLSDPKFTTYYLQNKLINVATETTARDPLGTELFKTIVSGEPTTTEKKYGHKFEIVPFAKMILAMNEDPVITDKSHGFARRVILIECTERFDEERRDPLLKYKLEAERDGIFMWMIIGLERLLKQGEFTKDEEVEAETERFTRGLNPVKEYALEHLDLDPKGCIEVGETYKHYADQAKAGGERVLARKRFKALLLLAFSDVKIKQDRFTRRACFFGIKRNSEEI